MACEDEKINSCGRYMIGDWVKYDKQYFQVDGYVRVPNTLFLKYNGHTAHYEDGCVVAEDTEPIPLTEEILKVNGFTKKHMEYERYMWKHPQGCTFLSQYSTHGWICLEDTDIELNYVHQLQHALRLCGLNDLADNFKIQ